MQAYRFYFMIGERIVQAEDAACADDADAAATAELVLQAADPSFDGIEVWRGTVRVCRHDRASLPQRR